MKFIFASLLMLFLAATSVGAAEHDHKSLDVKEIKFFKTYPLKTCIVSDEPFGGDMGEPLSFVHDGQEYTICCKSCIKKFAKDPHKYVAKLQNHTKKDHQKQDEHKSKDHDGHSHEEMKKEKHDHGDHKH